MFEGGGPVFPKTVKNDTDEGIEIWLFAFSRITIDTIRRLSIFARGQIASPNF